MSKWIKRKVIGKHAKRKTGVSVKARVSMIEWKEAMLEAVELVGRAGTGEWM